MSVALSRRHVLLGAGAAGLLTAAYPVLRQLRGSYPALVHPTQVLTAKEAHVFRIVGDWALPAGHGLPGSGGDDETLRRIDAFYASLDPDKQRLLRALPHVLEHGTALMAYGSRPLSSLTAARREQILRRWSQSPIPAIGQLWVATKLVYSFSYFERPDVLEAMQMPTACQT